MSEIHRRAYFVFGGYLLPDASGPSIGGVQTYIRFLAREFRCAGFEPIVVQFSTGRFEAEYDGVTVIGIGEFGSGKPPQSGHSLMNAVSERIDVTRDILVICSEQTGVSTKYARSIVIQHGVSWDIALEDLPARGLIRQLSLRFRIAKCMRRLYQAWKYKKMAECARYRVCVDYNFPNWLRTWDCGEASAVQYVIPNPVFGFIANSSQVTFAPRGTGTTRIVFARRFEGYRGVNVMIDVARALLRVRDGIEVTFAGSGPQSEAVSALAKELGDRVQVTKYDADEAVAFHRGFDIAVVPSMSSEGTSLSVLEAMAAGCAVVSTPVGGISNVVVDGFTGKFVAPGSRDDLLRVLIQLIDSPSEQRRLAQNAFEMICQGPFSHQKWSARWQEIIRLVMRGGV